MNQIRFGENQLTNHQLYLPSRSQQVVKNETILLGQRCSSTNSQTNSLKQFHRAFHQSVQKIILHNKRNHHSPSTSLFTVLETGGNPVSTTPKATNPSKALALSPTDFYPASFHQKPSTRTTRRRPTHTGYLSYSQTVLLWAHTR